MMSLCVKNCVSSHDFRCFADWHFRSRLFIRMRRVFKLSRSCSGWRCLADFVPPVCNDERVMEQTVCGTTELVEISEKLENMFERT